MTEREAIVACPICNDSEWVCENHPNIEWAGLSGKEECCGGAGMPCRLCNHEMSCAGWSHQAAKAEREAIVAWLREQSRAFHKMASEVDNSELKTLWHRDGAIALHHARAIEAGQHLGE